ncbi:hypothetical protein BC835DRAFT_1522427 [Cytidiella melzeri]|nr:hypothetical protein BC835DRAFT_1522427 [Cytidiella melzeri]
MTIPPSSQQGADASSPEHYYTVFNLPVTASGEEIRDRYRQLSLIFHPDKQPDERLKEIATQKFLQLQQAYEVLSDSTFRQAYDLYGLQGVELVRKTELDGLPSIEFRAELARRKAYRDYMRGQQVTQSSGATTIALNATSLFEELDTDLSPLQSIWLRLTSIQANSMRLRNSFKKSLGAHTDVTCSSTVYAGIRGTPGRRRAALGTSFTGLLTHQLSPNWSVNVATDFLKTANLRASTVYDDGDNQLGLEAHLSPILPMLTPGNSRFTLQNRVSSLVPPVSVSYGRRLYPNSQGLATLTVSTADSIPALSLAFSTGESAWDGFEDKDELESGASSYLPSSYGFSSWRARWTIGIQLQGALPSLFAACGIAFEELGLRLYGSLDSMSSLTFGAVWNAVQDAVASGPLNLSAQITISLSEISLRLKVTYYNQTVQVPIILYNGYDTTVAFWTTIVPSASVALAYCFVLRPRQRRRRVEYVGYTGNCHTKIILTQVNRFFRQARTELREAHAVKIRPVEETVSLLREAAGRHMKAEASVDGLIITGAQYGPAERDEAARGLDIDVTIPLQVLTNNSQLFIPGRRSKAGLPGFYDPAPSLAKTLRIHYTFRGRPHYAELPDHMPVVLPLEGGFCSVVAAINWPSD